MAGHLFVSATGALLPRWLEAFPAATGARLEDAPAGATQLGLIWLRLSADIPVAQQIAEVRKNYGNTPIVVLSDVPKDNEAVSSFSAAAKGYCNSHAGPEVLQKVAAVVLQGGLWIGEMLMLQLLAAQRHVAVPVSEKQKSWRDLLTQREIEVAGMAAVGTSNKEIARRLDITERTVKAHMGAILEKLNVRDRLQLALLIGDRQRS